MAHPAGESESNVLRLDFDRRLVLQLVTSESPLRELLSKLRQSQVSALREKSWKGSLSDHPKIRQVWHFPLQQA